LADRSYTPWKIKRGIEKTFVTGATQVTQADTLTFSELKSTANPLKVLLFLKSTGAEVTCTYAAGSNTATVTGAGTNVDCIFVAWGYNA
jgi:hypothetical protein